jgi:hypothetical protein
MSVQHATQLLKIARRKHSRIEDLEAALNEILREATSLQYAQQVARDALYPKGE